MNLQEFAALKVGDQVECPMNGVGQPAEVVEVTAGGVKLRWGKSSREIFYSVQSTIWFHWSKVPPQEPNPE